MILIKCTYKDESFFRQLVDLYDEFNFISSFEGYDMNYSDTSKKGRLKCKSAFAAKEDPFVGIWRDGIPIKGFYSESNDCNINNVKEYLIQLQNENAVGITESDES